MELLEGTRGAGLSETEQAKLLETLLHATSPEEARSWGYGVSEVCMSCELQRWAGAGVWVKVGVATAAFC